MTATRDAIAVVGGGPAGLFGAQQLAESGFAVTVYDRMPSVGRKLLLAGRGGLNLTHNESMEEFLTRYGSEGSIPPNQILAAVRRFDGQALRKWADELGAETFVGTSGRVFPKALRATPLLRAWLGRLVELGVRFEGGWEFAGFGPSAPGGSLPYLQPKDRAISGDQHIASIEATYSHQHVVLQRVIDVHASRLSNGDRHEGRLALNGPVLLALGGATWPRLGADGSWVTLFRRSGIAVHDLRASNCGLRIAWSEHVTRFAGQPLKNVSLTINGITKRGELLIDPKGIEGSAAYAIGQAADKARSMGIDTVQLDLRADVSLDHLEARLSKRSPKMSIATWLTKSAGLSPQAIAVLREVYGSTVPTEPSEMAKTIKGVPLRLEGTFPIERAISTAGGVALDGIDEHFMLRSHAGVFVAGEMLDWDAPTGGYLLHACFATGFAAAKGIARYSASN